MLDPESDRLITAAPRHQLVRLACLVAESVQTLARLHEIAALSLSTTSLDGEIHYRDEDKEAEYWKLDARFIELDVQVKAILDKILVR